MEEKSLLRKKYRQIRESEIQNREELSERICTLCASLPEFLAADTVLLYAAKGSEVDLSSLFYRAVEMGKTVGYPRCVERRVMVFQGVDDLSQLCLGAYGIKEPSADAPVIEVNGACVFIPALSFDRHGYRLGYGGGYYDTFLEKHSGCKVGVTFDACIADRLPREEHDKKSDYIITESQVKRTIED